MHEKVYKTSLCLQGNVEYSKWTTERLNITSFVFVYEFQFTLRLQNVSTLSHKYCAFSCSQVLFSAGF